MHPNFPIRKSSGTTQTEQLLERLAASSFLSIWSWPRPFKDDGKELCDLIAIFEDRVLVFFDRESRILETSDRDLELVWSRWKKHVVDKQIATAKGADRYLRSGRTVYIDDRMKTPMPLPLAQNLKVHKIVIAHGAKGACKAHSEANVSGSLAISYAENIDELAEPFHVRLNRSDPVHVLDSENLEIVFRELDTFGDFIAYLDEKEIAIGQLDLLSYCGEEDLLGYYLSNFDDGSKRYRIAPIDKQFNFVHVGEGIWQSLRSSDPYLRRKEANAISYIWDRVIEKSAENALAGTLIGNANVFGGKSAVHEMARERRFSRRMICENIASGVEAFPKTSEPLVRHLSFSISQDSDKGYVFLQVQGNCFDIYEEYREARRGLLEIACGAAKNRFPALKKVVGIAVEPPKYNKIISEDFVLLECADWSGDQRNHYDRLNEHIGFFRQSGRVNKGHAQDFPNPNAPRSKPGRNDPCSCGSGRKFKKCHGRF